MGKKVPWEKGYRSGKKGTKGKRVPLVLITLRALPRYNFLKIFNYIDLHNTSKLALGSLWPVACSPEIVSGLPKDLRGDGGGL